MTEIIAIAIVKRTEEVIEETVTLPKMKESQSVGGAIATEIESEVVVKIEMTNDIETGMSQVVVVPLQKAVILLLLDRNRLLLRRSKLLRSLSRS